jgi:hypothetical protein
MVVEKPSCPSKSQKASSVRLRERGKLFQLGSGVLLPQKGSATLTKVISILPLLLPTSTLALSPLVPEILSSCNFIFPPLVWKLACGEPTFLLFLPFLFPYLIFGISPTTGAEGSIRKVPAIQINVPYL